VLFYGATYQKSKSADTVTNDSELVQSQRPPDATNSTQQGCHAAAMPSIAAVTVETRWICDNVSIFVSYSTLHIRCVRVRVLEPGTQYVVSVRAFNDIDKGPVIYDLVYTATSQGAPLLGQLSLASLRGR